MMRIALVAVISFGFAGALGENRSAHSREAGGCPLGYSSCDREDPHIHCGHHDWETVGQYESRLHCPGCYRTVKVGCLERRYTVREVENTGDSVTVVAFWETYCARYGKWVKE